MKSIIVLAAHRAPPSDFPHAELSEFFKLHSQLEASHHSLGNGDLHALQERYEILEGKLRSWPRTEQNDPFFASSVALGRELEGQVGMQVLVGFNEYCNPSLEDSLAWAAKSGADRVVVITPMLTAGGAHAAVDIPLTIKAARTNSPDVEFIYAWPFESGEVAGFLAGQVRKYAEPELMRAVLVG